jgi:hypothetical protein
MRPARRWWTAGTTHGETAWLASEFDVGVGATVESEVAGTQTELPGRRMPMTPAKS